MQNALAEETSPYLLQHADNPVNWSQQALDQAQQEKNSSFYRSVIPPATGAT